MLAKSDGKINVDKDKKEDLAKFLPELAKDILLHMPAKIEPDRFIDHIILTEKLIKRSRNKEEGIGPNTSIVATAITMLLLLAILSYVSLKSVEIEVIAMLVIALYVGLLQLKGKYVISIWSRRFTRIHSGRVKDFSKSLHLQLARNNSSTQCRCTVDSDSSTRFMGGA